MADFITKDNVAGIMFVREEIAAGRLPAELDDLQKEASE